MGGKETAYKWHMLSDGTLNPDGSTHTDATHFDEKAIKNSKDEIDSREKDSRENESREIEIIATEGARYTVPKFINLESAQIPSSSLFLLDESRSMIYQFSYQLNLEKTLKAMEDTSFPLPQKEASGFGLTSNMDIFLAFDNQLFIAAWK